MQLRVSSEMKNHEISPFVQQILSGAQYKICFIWRTYQHFLSYKITLLCRQLGRLSSPRPEKKNIRGDYSEYSVGIFKEAIVRPAPFVQTHFACITQSSLSQIIKTSK